ncbi:hypothetical protein ABT010_33705 [Streptomyces sp. NPDC002668]|uniref:hypothetical protein n=1 Tax=Streptomyces sp. NPDC002668 TaxID=3154422 RepID=UPI0033246B97
MIFLVGKALDDGLCKLCREDAVQAEAPHGQAQSGPTTCTGGGRVPCNRPALPTRTVCARHRAQELAAQKEAS